MIYEYIKSNYEVMEPIFFSELPTDGTSKSALVQRLSSLCEQGLLDKYDSGVYFIPKKSKLNVKIGPSADVVAKYKYVYNGKVVKGYYAGHTFANQLGITTQVPRKVEIVSNNCSAKYRDVEIGKRHFVLRRSPFEINLGNVYVLQLLDLLKNIDTYMDGGDFEGVKPKVYKYIRDHHIRKSDVDAYIRKFPLTVFKNYYEMELQNVLA